jgi:hypothetical protein
MNRTVSNLGPALFLAIAIVAAGAVTAAAPHALWAAVAGPLLLALSLVGIDLVQRRRAGHSRPSPVVLLLAAVILVSCGIVASRDLKLVGVMIPILGSSVAVPFILLPQGARTACRRA